MTIKFIIGAIILILLIVIFILGYVKARPDQAVIISGLRRKPKILIGKAGIRIPFLERMDRVSLRLISVDVKTASSVPTADYINISVDSTVNVKVGTDKVESGGTLLDRAMQNFLNMKDAYICEVARQVLEGNVREIVGKMKLEEMVNDRQKFADLVRTSATPDLAAMGLEIISFNVQNFIDQNCVIENLGVDNIVRIQKSAAISRAESERDIQKAQAEANQEAENAKNAAALEIAKVKAATEQQSREAQIEADTLVAIKENNLEVKRAELKKAADLKKAEADAAYTLEQQNQRKSIEQMTGEAEIAKQEKQIHIQEQEVLLKEKSLDAEVRKQAEAEKFATEQHAEAERYKVQQEADAALFERQKQAEAELFERQKKAEAMKFEKLQEAEGIRAIAEANKYNATQEAEGIRAKGEAEATAIAARLTAEADGLSQKADAMAKYQQGAILQMYFDTLPEIAKNVAEPLSKVDKITMYGDGNSAKFVGDVTTTIEQITSGIEDSVGIDLKALISGYLGSKL